MNKIIFMVFALALSLPALAQKSGTFKAYEKQEKHQMLRAYARTDARTFRQHLDNIVSAYNKLDKKDPEKEWGNICLKEDYYLMACTYAITGNKKEALDFIIKAHDDDYKELLEDHDLDILRKEPRFVKMMHDTKEMRSKYLTTLRNAPAYNPSGENNIPAFMYQEAGDTHLAQLKKTYNLDSVAGYGDDVSRIINLMEWVHYLIPHDGSKGNPDKKNALSFIKVCTRDKKTLNCRGLAIVLNEVYLAEGFKSRFVTCLPKDTADNDCHVITSVWSPSLKKWLWMDPTFMAYVMDEEGNLLSIEEVRSRLIANKPLILNPDANRNHAASQPKSYYLGYYMAKNLYKLECPVSSEYNYETKKEGKTRSYVTLLPGGSMTAAEQAKHNGSGFTNYYTSNPSLFWAAPSVSAVQAIKPKVLANFEQVMERYKNFYNSQLTDSVCNMFSEPEGMKDFSSSIVKNGMDKYGRLVSFKYLAQDADDPDVALFKMTYDKSVHVMGISIDANSKLETFRGETFSPYIDKLFAKEL